MLTRFIVLIFAIVPLAACTSKNDAPQSETTTATPNIVALTANEYTIQAPDTVAGGWTTLRLTNHGNEIHYGHMVRLESGTTAQELLTAYAEAIRTSAARPKTMTRFGGPGGTAPGDSSSVTQYLEPGNYVWICPVEDESGTPHFSKGEFKPFVVTAATGNAADRAAAPSASTTIRLVDYSFAVDSTLGAGRHTVRVENAGKEGHDLVLMKLAPGRTVDDMRKWLNPEKARRPGQADDPQPSFESMATLAGGIATIASGMESFFETNLAPGEYVMACMTTAPDGRSHIEHGMIQQVTIR